VSTPRSLPAKLGRYDVGAKIGGGGMATIYLGRHRDGQGHESLAALKVIKDELAETDIYRDMFFDEAKILSRLSHANVIHTLEYGVEGDNRFIAMELLLGRSLMDVWDLLAARGETIPIELGVWICARVAAGLHAAHELRADDGSSLDVIHRDVNPSNVFLTYDGVVKLIDFGLAKSVGRRTKSKSGIVKGKVPYLSPEQITESVLDRRTDLYALGTTLWEVATMNRLFKRENDVATLQAIKDAVVPDVRLINPAIPGELWKVIEKALQRDRDQRYSTAEEIRKDIDDYLAANSPETGPATLAAFLDQHFSGDRREQIEWVAAASLAGPRRPQFTMPPPTALPEVPLKVIVNAPHLITGKPPPLPSGASGAGQSPRLPAPNARPSTRATRTRTSRKKRERGRASSIPPPPDSTQMPTAITSRASLVAPDRGTSRSSNPPPVSTIPPAPVTTRSSNPPRHSSNPPPRARTHSREVIPKKQSSSAMVATILLIAVLCAVGFYTFFR
jgi:serine/threonine-protein kinase